VGAVGTGKWGKSGCGKLREWCGGAGGIVSLWLYSCGCHVVAWHVARNVKDKRFISCYRWAAGWAGTLKLPLKHP